jgi:phosphoglycolate phosphatase-like HAD superfamily hydrolase
VVRVVAVDYDGTLVDSFSGAAAIVSLKIFFFRHLRLLYTLGELVEVAFCRRPRLHNGAAMFVARARRHGMLIGVVTDRSLFSFAISARRAGFPLEKLHFIHARRSWFDRFIRLPAGVRVLTSSYYKGDPRALLPFQEFLGGYLIGRREVCLIGDDERDHVAARQLGFRFIPVDRKNPDFNLVWRMLHT